MVEIRRIEAIVQEPDRVTAIRARRKDKKTSEKEKRRLARKKRARAEKDSSQEPDVGHTGSGGDVDIHV